MLHCLLFEDENDSKTTEQADMAVLPGRFVAGADKSIFFAAIDVFGWLLCGIENCLNPFIKSPGVPTNNNNRLASAVL
jgi:hypothetical protein